MKYLKHLKISPHEIIAVALIVFAFLLRLGLLIQGWPLTNSDEGTIGLMGLHIAFKGEHPTFYYGQYYMGPHQAFLAALLFHLFHPSLFIMRLGLLLVCALFLGSTYVLTRVIYSKGWALISLFMLTVGSSFIFQRELTAIGGYTETLLFGSLLLLLASWLVVTYRPYQRFRECRWRIIVYLLWGVIAGTALWDDLLIAPFALMTGLVIVAFCWRELLQLVTPLAAFIGLIVGMFPLLYFNLHAPRGSDSITTLLKQSGSGGMSASEKLTALARSIDISVPMITGEPFCQANELPFLGPITSYSPACQLARGLWGYGYMFLLAVALLLAFWGLWQAWRAWRANRHVELAEVEQETLRWLRRQGIHLALLICGVLTFYLYAKSRAPLILYDKNNAPLPGPGIHARYLIGLLIVTPAIFWPLWQGFTLVTSRARMIATARRVVCGTLLALICALLVVGSVSAYTQVPEVHASNERDQGLINTLTKYHVSHFYSEYWTCNKITFLSNESLICAVLDSKFEDSHNRYHLYYDIVKADPRAAYVFPIDSGFVARSKDGKNYHVPVLDERMRNTGITYQTFVVDGYIIYLPR